MISQNFLVLTLYSWDHTDHPTVRHDTWNGQIKGYRVLHVPFPLDNFPHTSPHPAPSRAAQLNTVIGDIRRLFDKVSFSPTDDDMMTDQTLHCCSGTTTALNSLQPFTNYSIQVTFWDVSTIRCLYIVHGRGGGGLCWICDFGAGTTCRRSEYVIDRLKSLIQAKELIQIGSLFYLHHFLN